MSFLFPPHLPPPVSFPCTLCSPPAPTSPPSASSTSTARIRQRSPCASACHWRESGPLTDFAMHNPTAFLEHPHEFSCSDNVTMIPATQGLPVASRGPNVFGLISTRKPVCECHLSVLHKQRETGADVEKESVATTIFSPTSKGKRDRDKKCCAVVERQGESSKNLGTES